MSVEHLAPQLALTLGAVCILLLALILPRRKQGICAPLSVLVATVAIVLAARLHVRVSPTLSFSGTWALDDLTTWATYVVLGSTVVVSMLSPRWLQTDRRHGEWYVMLLFSALGAILLAGAADLLELMVAMLLVSVTGYTLASYHRASRMSAEAGAKFYFLGALANPLLFLGIVVLYAIAGSTGYSELAEALAGREVDRLAAGVGVALVLIGLSYELGAFPAHPWVPDVAQGSPAPAAAFLTVVPKLGAIVALMRFASLVPDTLLAWRPLVAVVAALTMTIGNLAALWQEDVRRLLGWSSVAQAGYGLMAVVALGSSKLALPALLLFLVAYATANLGCFGVVVALRGRTELGDYRGLGQKRPALAVALVVGLLSLLGIPPLIGFTAKLVLFGATIEAGYSWLAIVAVVNTVVSAFYYLRVIATMYLAERDGKVATLHWAATVAALACVALVVLTGLSAELISASGVTAVALP